MTFKLKADTIFVIRYALEEIYYLDNNDTTGKIISRFTLFLLTKKFTNKQLQLYKDLPIDEKKRHAMRFEIHEAVLLRSILQSKTITENQYSNVLLDQFIAQLQFLTT